MTDVLRHANSFSMPQSLSKLYVHLIFSTKGRERILSRSIQGPLHAYLGGILRKQNCDPVEINTEPDHAHILFVLARTEALSDLVAKLKQGSTLWLREQHPLLRTFHWQSGYGAFSVSQSTVPEVVTYIRNQQEHHRDKSFQDEFRAMLKRYEIEWDEKYVWD